MKFLHIAISEKFLPPFIQVIERYLDPSEHLFCFITSEKYEFGLKPGKNIQFFHHDSDFKILLNLMNEAHKIILHGLWRKKINSLLVDNPALFKKCYWIMWGADFYFPQNHDATHKMVIKKIPYVISGVAGDVDLIRKNYGSEAVHIEGLIYAKDYNVPFQPFTSYKPSVTILLGNSGAETNRHLEAIESLRAHDDQIHKIYAPLSYAGSDEYIQEVVGMGQKYFSERFVPLTKYLVLEMYIDLLRSVDIAYFNHNRQQGLGNILLLLKAGKKVFIDSRITTFSTFKEKGFFIFDKDRFNTLPLKEEEANINVNLDYKYYSEDANIALLSRIFGDK